MRIGMMGLGRMGSNMVRRILRAANECVVYDVVTAAAEALGAQGAEVARSPRELVQKLAPPRVVWLMLPAALVDQAIAELASYLEPGDTIVDGGNSHYAEDLRRARTLAERRLHYVDVGVSGGVFGLERGYCQMIGGEAEVVAKLDPIFAALAPRSDVAVRTRGKEGELSPAERGYLHCGPAGAGHFVKMVHNGIEYGIMEAYAEGFNILERADIGKREHTKDAETAPLAAPERYRYDFDLPAIAELWRRGSVVTSWLLDLTAEALARDPGLDGFAGRVSDSGEGRWTLHAAIDLGVPAPVLSDAVYQRFSSRDEGSYANRLLAAMRQAFGGHEEKK